MRKQKSRILKFIPYFMRSGWKDREKEYGGKGGKKKFPFSPFPRPCISLRICGIFRGRTQRYSAAAAARGLRSLFRSVICP